MLWEGNNVLSSLNRMLDEVLSVDKPIRILKLKL